MAADALIYDAVQKMAAELSALRARVDSIEIRESSVSTLTSSDGTLTAVIVDATGNVTKPYQPAFSAYNTVTDVTQTGNGAAATVDFDTEDFDVGSNFSGDTFTAPITGKYLLIASVRVVDIDSAMVEGNLRITTTNHTFYTNYVNPYAAGQSGAYTFMGATIENMNADDTATVQVVISGGVGNTADIYGAVSNTNRFTYFAGALLV